MTPSRGSTVTPRRTTKPPGAGWTMRPVMVAANTARRRQAEASIPTGAGAEHDQGKTARTAAQRITRRPRLRAIPRASTTTRDHALAKQIGPPLRGQEGRHGLRPRLLPLVVPPAAVPHEVASASRRLHRIGGLRSVAFERVAVDPVAFGRGPHVEGGSLRETPASGSRPPRRTSRCRGSRCPRPRCGRPP